MILGLDISTKTTGVALFEDLGNEGKLKLLTHVTPKIKPKPNSKIEELFKKVDVFHDFIIKYKDIGIKKIIIEEPLLRSNNVNTIGVLLRFNGMISKLCYDVLGVIPEFISSYDARKYAFPELMVVRKYNKKGVEYTEKQMKNKNPVLFGGYGYDIDKKKVIWEKVSELEPQITWLYNKKGELTKENFDMADSYTACRGFMLKNKVWER